MASVETYIINLLKAGSFALGAYLVVTYVIPLVRGFLSDVVKYGNTVNNFVKLLVLMVYVIAAKGIIASLGAIGDKLPGYASLANPAISVIDQFFFPTLRLLIIGVGILLVVERIRLK